MSFLEQLDSDMEDAFLNTAEFGETVTYLFADGTTKSIACVFNEQIGAIDVRETGRCSISSDATVGIEDPQPGEQIQRSSGEIWTIIDVRGNQGAFDLRVIQPLERV